LKEIVYFDIKAIIQLQQTERNQKLIFAFEKTQTAKLNKSFIITQTEAA